MVQLIDHDPALAGIQIEVLDDFLAADFVLRDNGSNETGLIRYAALHLNGAEPGAAASGSGSLALITFEPLREGSFAMPVTHHQLVDSEGFEIEATAEHCTVTISEPPAPEVLLYLPLVFPGITDPLPLTD